MHLKNILVLSVVVLAVMFVVNRVAALKAIVG